MLKKKWLKLDVFGKPCILYVSSDLCSVDYTVLFYPVFFVGNERKNETLLWYWFKHAMFWINYPMNQKRYGPGLLPIIN